MKNNKAEYNYYVIKVQPRHVRKKKLDGFIEIKSYEHVPNSSIYMITIFFNYKLL